MRARNDWVLSGDLGRRLSSAQPQPQRGELDHGEKFGGELVIACGDAAEVLQLGEEPLDQIALAVEPLVEAGLPARGRMLGGTPTVLGDVLRPVTKPQDRSSASCLLRLAGAATEDRTMKAALQNYHARMQRVLDHIDRHLDDDLDLDTLSSVQLTQNIISTGSLRRPSGYPCIAMSSLPV